MRVESPRCTFVKPLVWQPEHYGTLIKEAMERSGVRSTNNITIVSQTPYLKIGEYETGSGLEDFDKYVY